MVFIGQELPLIKYIQQMVMFTKSLFTNQHINIIINT